MTPSTPMASWARWSCATISATLVSAIRRPGPTTITCSAVSAISLIDRNTYSSIDTGVGGYGVHRLLNAI